MAGGPAAVKAAITVTIGRKLLARRRHYTFIRHYVAMQLLLCMEDADGSYPNVDYVRKNKSKDLQPVSKIKRVAAKGSKTRKPIDPKRHIDFLQDFFRYVDPEVYDMFNLMLKKAVNVRAMSVDADMVLRTVNGNSRMLQRITDPPAKDVALWGDPPHPCGEILREVVADLLA